MQYLAKPPLVRAPAAEPTDCLVADSVSSPAGGDGPQPLHCGRAGLRGEGQQQAASQRSLHKVRRHKADLQVERPASRVSQRAVDGYLRVPVNGSFAVSCESSRQGLGQRSSRRSSRARVDTPGRRRGLRRMGGRCKWPERSQLIAAGAARCSGPGGRLRPGFSGLGRGGLTSDLRGPTTSAAALRPPGSGRRQVPPRRRWPPAPRGRRRHAPAWRPRRWRRRPSWRWTRSPAGASGR